MDNLIAGAVLVGVGVLAAVRELSARRTIGRLERELSEARTRLDTRNDLADVGQLVSGLAQELKSPLQGVIGNTELMLASHTTAAGDTEELQQIRDNATRAAGIVRNLIAFTETTSLARRWHDIKDIIDHAVDARHAELTSDGVEVTLVTSDRLPLVYVDGRQLEKVLVTLLGRSVRAARAVGGAQGAGARVHASITTRRSSSPDDRLIVEIEDDGPPVGLEDAFGSGGLGACDRIVEAHGGSIRVLDRLLGVGVRIDLPIAAVPEATTTIAPDGARNADRPAAGAPPG